MAADIFKRYMWVLTTISRYNKISLKDLADLYQNNMQISDGERLNERTFHRWRGKIYEIFNIEILCDKNLYYIENLDGIRGGNTHTWLLNTIATSNIIAENQNLKQRIAVEDYSNSERFLPIILYAMQDSVRLMLKYKKFDSQSVDIVLTEPYGIKSFHRRWYLLANKRGDKLRIYALDRIVSLERTDEKFVFPKDFSIEEYFMSFYGVYADTTVRPQTVKLKVFGKDVNYIRTLPLHFTQKEIQTTEDYSVFSLYLAPTYDFVQEILAFGSAAEVLAPQSLREGIINRLKENLKQYKVIP